MQFDWIYLVHIFFWFWFCLITFWIRSGWFKNSINSNNLHRLFSSSLASVTQTHSHNGSHFSHDPIQQTIHQFQSTVGTSSNRVDYWTDKNFIIILLLFLFPLCRIEFDRFNFLYTFDSSIYSVCAHNNIYLHGSIFYYIFELKKNWRELWIWHILEDFFFRDWKIF